MEQLEPKLGMLALVAGSLFKDVGDLDIAVLLSLGCIIGVLVGSLRLSCEGGHQIGLGTGTFQIFAHKIIPPN